MNSPLNEDWLDEIARRRWSAAEADRWRRALSERPTEARRFEEEMALNQLLDAVPPTRASSNFTARVLADIGRSPKQDSRILLAWRRAWASIAYRIPGRGPARETIGARATGSAFRRWFALRSLIFRSLISPAAIALVALAFSLNWGWQRVQVHRHGAMARTAAEWSSAAAMPGVAALQDFEAIQWLETRSAPDDVALLQLLREDVPGALP